MLWSKASDSLFSGRGGLGACHYCGPLKQSHYCGSVGSVRGTLVLIVVLHFLARFNKEFAVSGLGDVPICVGNSVQHHKKLKGKAA